MAISSVSGAIFKLLCSQIKQPLHRHLELQEVEAPRISRQFTHKGAKVVSPMHWLPLPPHQGDVPRKCFQLRETAL
jgi:hypothetical protein